MSEFVFLFRTNEEDRRQAMGTPERAQKAIQAWVTWMRDLEAKGLMKSYGKPLEIAGKVVRRGSVTDPIQLGICKHPVAAGPAGGGRPADITPGNPDASVMPYRMDSTSPAIAMPQIGRSVVDTHGLALINEWISEMPGSCN